MDVLLCLPLLGTLCMLIILPGHGRCLLEVFVVVVVVMWGCLEVLCSVFECNRGEFVLIFLFECIL